MSGPHSLSAFSSQALRGHLRPPGDKSISHRALLLGLLTLGETRIEGLLEGEDVLHTAKACQALGARVHAYGEGRWSVWGAGLGSLLEPAESLDFGNSGTGARLVMGLVAGHAIRATFDGDASLRKRPMRRILDPLILMGMDVISETEGGRCPLTLQGTAEPIPLEYETPVPSAQIKSAILLAGLNSLGTICVLEKEASRDHTEKMLRYFGAHIDVEPYGEYGRKITLHGRPTLTAKPIHVPGDPSSAAFPLVAALLVPRSEIILEGVMINPLRTGLLRTLQEMGGNITLLNPRMEGEEEIADIQVRASSLYGVNVPATRAPHMIDEYPILAVAAAFAQGVTRMRGLHELRVKESDRLQAIVKGLHAQGVSAHIEGDDLVVEGLKGEVRGGGFVETHLDHRIAMSFLVMGLATQHPVRVDDTRMIATSFPNFIEEMQKLGARFG